VQYDAELLPTLIRFLSGHKIEDSVQRARVCNVLLALLTAFLAQRPRHDKDADSRTMLRRSIIGRILANDGVKLSAGDLGRCFRQSPGHTMRCLSRRFGSLLSLRQTPAR
jgi:hypothetical protein